MSDLPINLEVMLSLTNELIGIRKAIKTHCQDCTILFGYAQRHDGEERCDDLECPLFEFCPFKKT